MYETSHRSPPPRACTVPDLGKLALWGPETLGCVLHVPGHWVALTRPAAACAQTLQNAALMCDSLYRQPFSLSVDEVSELFAHIGVWQHNASHEQAGMWCLSTVTLVQGEVPPSPPPLLLPPLPPPLPPPPFAPP